MNPEPPELLAFEKDAAGQRIYPVNTAKINMNEAAELSLEGLVRLAADCGTPHFVINCKKKKVHYAYLPYAGLVIAYEDAKPAQAMT